MFYVFVGVETFVYHTYQPQFFSALMLLGLIGSSVSLIQRSYGGAPPRAAVGTPNATAQLFRRNGNGAHTD